MCGCLSGGLHSSHQRTPAPSRRLRCCTSIRTPASTAGCASMSARCRPSSRKRIFRKSGSSTFRSMRTGSPKTGEPDPVVNAIRRHLPDWKAHRHSRRRQDVRSNPLRGRRDPPGSTASCDSPRRLMTSRTSVQEGKGLPLAVLKASIARRNRYCSLVISPSSALRTKVTPSAARAAVSFQSGVASIG